MTLEHIEITLDYVLLREMVMGNTCVELNPDTPSPAKPV